jgi:glycine betaine/choline ABC-type transport system substrate-binding protein
MGTRNLTVVKNAAGDTKIALYGQWDGYPSYSGTTALAFLRDKTNRENLKQRLTLVQFITDEEADVIYKSFDSTDWENKDFLTEYPALHRDTGVKILEAVASATETVKTIDNTEFANDSLFCEGIYEVDFSTNSFITRYNGITVEFDLDNLPTDEEYLEVFENDLTNA